MILRARLSLGAFIYGLDWHHPSEPLRAAPEGASLQAPIDTTLNACASSVFLVAVRRTSSLISLTSIKFE
ncbi:hypothetical protein AB4589_17240 [Vibrio sp. 10N.222.49.A3]|uniref:hypothetical protein n=1 Tax=Vibrio TaxID=662 RepID=UPI001056AA97|nr:hypothetical protein [Vibrio splendidus]MCW4446264.1 hypothetical protein [Vibrio splendidus]CAK2399400.1 hypothetical protein VCRA2119O48_110145 [Vibrio crassostreae]CAK4004629.1 hypothetical protein VCRA212O16_640019 [Vibrio crassostreae]